MDNTQSDQAPEAQEAPKPKAQPTELLSPEDPIMQAWLAVRMILAEINAPKTGRFRKLRAGSGNYAPGTRNKKPAQPAGPLRG